MPATPDPARELLALFPADPPEPDVWTDLPYLLEPLGGAFWERQRHETPTAFQAGLSDLARGPWLHAVRSWESWLARLAEPRQGVPILRTITHLAWVEGPDRARRRTRCMDVLRCYLSSTSPTLQAMAVAGLGLLQPGWVLERVRLQVEDAVDRHDWELSGTRGEIELQFKIAAYVLARSGVEEDWPLLVGLMGSDRGRVARYTETLVGLFNHRVGMSQTTARRLLDAMVLGTRDEPGGWTSDRFLVCIKMLRCYQSAFFPKAMAIFIRQGESQTIALIKGVPELIPALESLARDPHEPACKEALVSLASVDLPRALRVIREQGYLVRFHPDLQETAARLVSQNSPTVDFLDEAIQCSRTGRPRIQKWAMRLLAGIPAPEAAAEVVSMLSDRDRSVAHGAREFLEGDRGLEVFTDSLARVHGPDRAWWEIRRDALRVLDWGETIGRKLLGRMVHVRPTRKGHGFTFGSRDARSPAVISVSERPILLAAPHGRQVVQGLLLHEIAHHMYDFSERGFWVVAKPIRRAGQGPLFNLLCDERIERRMRRDVPGSSIYFDRLAAHVFCHQPLHLSLTAYAKKFGLEPAEAARRIQAGALPGGLSASSGDPAGRLVTLSGMDLARLPGAEVPFLQFAMMLRAKYPRHEGIHPAALMALDLIPSDLRNLDHHRMRDLTAKVFKVLGGKKEMNRRMARLGNLLEGLLTRGGVERWAVLRRLGAGMDPDFLRENGTTRDTCNRTSWREELEHWERRTGKGRPRSRSLGSGDGGGPVSYDWNEDPDRDFPPMKVRPLPVNLDAEVDPDPDWRRHARTLGRLITGINNHREVPGWSWQGRRLDPGRLRSLLWQKNYRCMHKPQEVLAPRFHFGLLIDKSGSMNGSGILRARSFAMLLCEALKDRDGITGHVAAFDHDTYYELGTLDDHRIPFLYAGGANNDAGALHESAKRFPSDPAVRKIIIMISDGLPTESSVAAVRYKVETLKKQGFVCVQVVVAELKTDCFRHFVDLSRYPLGVAVARFGRLVMHLIERAA